MIEVIDNVIVIGHHNPDTDAAAAACGYAEFLNRIGRYDRHVLGAIPGEMTPQARYVFERAGIAEPILIDNVAPRVGHVMNRDPVTFHVNDRIGSAIEKLIRKDLSMLPIVDGDNKLQGVFSHRSEAAKYLMGFDPTPLWGTLLDVEDLLGMPGIEVLNQGQANSEGNLVIALDGNGQWIKDLIGGDVVVCGNLDALKQIPEDRKPGCVVLTGVNSAEISDVECGAEQGITILKYDQSVAEFLRSLALHIRLGSLEMPTGACVGQLDKIDDIRNLIGENYHALPVLDEYGKLEGIISRGDMQRKDCCQVILVDHFEYPQAVPGIEKADVLEILDHHRVGNIETGSPIRVQCRPVGSSCTIVASNFFENGVDLDPGVAILLLGGIVADTLVLSGPTTTDVDREIAPRLAEIAGVELKEFGTDVLVAGDDLATSEPEDIWNRDQKQFSIRNQNFAVAQLETASLEHLPSEKLAQYQELVKKDQKENGRLLSMLALTDVLKGDSWMFVSESEEASGVARETFSEKEPKPGWVEALGVVSRKKQMIPQLMQSLSKA